jgi:arylsulfatase A
MYFNCKILIAFFVIFQTESACFAQTPIKKYSKPNIVIFLVDDLGYGDLGCYGNPIIQTPNIDKFAQEGVLLTDCHSGGTVCSPSRASLLTGRNPYRLGFYNILGGGSYLKSKEITIAEMLKANGYSTCFVGKWHLSVLEKNKVNEPGPEDQGFDYWMGTTHNVFDGPANTKEFIKNGVALGKVDGWFCDVIVNEANEWLSEKRDKLKPFFLLVATHEPHTPIAPPVKYSKMYDNGRVDSLEKSINYGYVGRPDKDILVNKKQYYGTITQLDKAFGRLLKKIDSLGLRKNTIIFITSDNGPENPVTNEESLGQWTDSIRDNCFGTPGIYRGMKRFVYEGGHRIPGIVRFPGVIPAGTKSSQLFVATDLFPTICKIENIPLPKGVKYDGVANFNAFLKKPVKRIEPAIWFYPNYEDTYFRLPEMEMRCGKYTIIGWLPPKPDSMTINNWFFKYGPVKYELYNLKDDPAQQKDIAEKKPEIVNRLKGKMAQLWKEMRDEGNRRN